jgi:hypothetical protein
MEGFTPTFFLQLVIALMAGVGSYYAIKTDLRNCIDGLKKETALREKHEEEDDKTHHDIRGEVGVVSNRVAILEGRMTERGQ